MAAVNADARLPDALARFDEIRALIGGRRPSVFLDYDGTLTPIVARPDLAVLGEATRQVLRELAALCTVAVVSGRDLADIQHRVGLDRLSYAGSHGFDIAGPNGLRIEHEGGAELVSAIAAAARELGHALADVEGALVEPKRFAVSVHFRQVAPDRVGEVEGAVDRVLAGFPELKKSHGKMLYELRPRLDWDKGRAVLWLLSALGEADGEHLPIYIGDDLTDEDAFRALRDRGLGIIVDGPEETAARYGLADSESVGRFLARLAEELRARREA